MERERHNNEMERPSRGALIPCRLVDAVVRDDPAALHEAIDEFLARIK